MNYRKGFFFNVNVYIEIRKYSVIYSLVFRGVLILRKESIDQIILFDIKNEFNYFYF